MKKRVSILLCLSILLFSLTSCAVSDLFSKLTKTPKSSSTFSIQFIDVGQGDSALVECDGRYMLIDGGDASHGDKVSSVLKDKEIQHLDILAISHLHEDHIGGLEDALMHEDHIGGLEEVLVYASKIDTTISNSDYYDSKTFRRVEHQLKLNGTSIEIPHEGDKYKLGSAEIEVVDVSAEAKNDSLVLLITYGKNKFLFTGDIEEKQQTRIANKYQNEKDEAYKVDLIKMPHHGAYASTLYRFVRTFMPDYAIISVGKNDYGHPDEDTLGLLKESEAKYYRTDEYGDIFVKSNGKEMEISTSS